MPKSGTPYSIATCLTNKILVSVKSLFVDKAMQNLDIERGLPQNKHWSVPVECMYRALLPFCLFACFALKPWRLPY